MGSHICPKCNRYVEYGAHSCSQLEPKQDFGYKANLIIDQVKKIDPGNITILGRGGIKDFQVTADYEYILCHDGTLWYKHAKEKEWNQIESP